jgi:hypothetical protein
MTMTENSSHSKSVLHTVQRQFEEWRNTREKQGPIPDSLWQSAESLYPEYSLSQISKALRLSYTDLKKRFRDKLPVSIPTTNPLAGFIELGVNPPMQAAECHIEMEDAYGGKMKAHFKGDDAGLNLLELCRIFWGKQL